MEEVGLGYLVTKSHFLRPASATFDCLFHPAHSFFPQTIDIRSIYFFKSAFIPIGFQ